MVGSFVREGDPENRSTLDAVASEEFHLDFREFQSKS